MSNLSTRLLIGALFLTLPAAAEAPNTAEEGTSLTVYSSADPAGFDPQRFISQQRAGVNLAWSVPGFGLVRDTRRVQIEKGLGELRFTDVASFIDPTTVGFTDLNARGTQVLEQNFEFDLVSPAKLLAKYVDREVSLQFDDAIISGTLLSSNSQSAVLETAEGVSIIPISDARVMLDALPGGLITRPTLVWKIDAAQGGEHLIRTTYETKGLTWRADYNLVLGKDDSAGDITAWVSLMNLSGMAFNNARLKLVAGDVQRVQPKSPNVMMRSRGIAEMDSDSLGFEEQSFFEYHMYTLPRRTDIASNGTQQLTLFAPIRGFPVKKELLFVGSTNMFRGSEPFTHNNIGSARKVKIGVFVEFENKREHGLGIPMPAGKVRLYKANPNDGALEFIGEDLIDHTPRNETIRLKVGDAFDVVGERKQDDFSIDEARKTMDETFTLEIRNQKDAAQEVVIREPLYRWRNWKITKSSAPFEKLDARTIEWRIEVPAEGTQSVTYTVHYSW